MKKRLGGPERYRKCLLLTKETRSTTNKIGSAYYSLQRLGKYCTTKKMLTIGREGKRKGFETETQEVLSTYTKRGIEAGI